MKHHPIYEIALTLIDNVGAVNAKQLLSYAGNAEAVLKMPAERLKKIPNIGDTTAQYIVAQRDLALKRAEQICANADKTNTRILVYGTPEYPQRLAKLHDSPLVLYCVGDAVLDAPKVVAIVGTRHATEYGKQATEEIVAALKAHNALVVSGLAYGIDVMAHRACVREGLPTAGVLAGGLDKMYPAAHHKIALEMVQAGGALLTEAPFGTPADASRFPARNRIIAGLAEATIVVEARAKGGALITARLANDYNRDVFAVPGSLFSPASEGCHDLIKAHQAHLFTSIRDIEYYLGWTNEQAASHPRQASLNFEQYPLNQDERNILQLLQAASPPEMHLDTMAYQLQMSMAALNAYMLNLELLGLVRALPGKKFGLGKA